MLSDWGSWGSTLTSLFLMVMGLQNKTVLETPEENRPPTAQTLPFGLGRGQGAGDSAVSERERRPKHQPCSPGGQSG